MNKKLLLIIGFCFLIISCQNTLLPASRYPKTINGIRAAWKQCEPKAGVNVFSNEPKTIAPYKTGSLTNGFLKDGLNTLNFVRYLAGLPEVELHKAYNNECQAGALVMAVNKTLSHYPAKPAGMDNGLYKTGYDACGSSNIASGYSTLDATVIGYCNDSDAGNIDRVGHRRWILNPRMAKTGFGFVTSNSFYSAMKSFDSSGSEKRDYVLWPSKGFFPDKFFGPSQAWSVSLDSGKYSNAAAHRAGISVQLTCLNNASTWIFTSADTNKYGKYFNIDTGGYGMNFCIIFRPDNLTSILSTNKFKVEINGLKDRLGNAMDKIEYEVEFFKL